MNRINFTKMHGLGNDFIIVESQFLPENVDYEKLSSKLCDRHFGIGADGLILVKPNINKSDTDITWRIFNSDGSEPEMCGNGIRCFAKYVFDKGIINKNKFTVSTLAGVISPEIEDNELITVDMGQPILQADKIPVNIDSNQVIDHSLKVLDKVFNINCVSMGNPHCIIFTDEDVDLNKYGPALETNPIFPLKTNVEFVKIINRDLINVKVWERGCGITLACGTGACASVVAGVINNLIDSKVNVKLPGGELIIHFDQSLNKVLMSGPAEYICEGQVIN